MVLTHICGLYYIVPPAVPTWHNTPDRKYLPQVSLSVHAQIIASTSRTTLTQTFINPSKEKEIAELRYTFPLYDGVSVVGFVCTINGNRVIRGIVKERAEARQTYDAAVARGETAGLFEQLPEASDVFTTTIGNVPAGAEIKVDITYLGELKHDAEVDGIRFTIPTSIAPRYGSYPGEMLQATNVDSKAGINIVVDAEMPDGSNIKNVQSPSHPIAVTIGNTSVGAASGADMSLQKASATLSLGTAELGQDFVLHVVATNTANPIAVLESHPTIPNHRALMATLVPKFNLPSSRPEIVFLCDRSGSMGSGPRVPNMKAALQVFLKSLPVGVKFNICSFGSRHEFLFKKGSKSYDASTLKEASKYVDTFDSDFGGTEIYRPMEEIFKNRFKDMELEVFLLTDGEIWDQNSLFTMINKYTAESKGAIRLFTLGIGNDVSHALIEGVARAGNGFSQVVGDNEKMNSKVVRMLKASLSPHVSDYTLEVKYANEPADDTDDGFEIVEKVMDALSIDVRESEPKPEPEAKKPISLFDTSANPDVEIPDASLDKTAGGKYAHVPPVAEPKLLQAPFEIPPLFPFSRTSVYLLMAPESLQKTPKSVVLRGTSSHGPLELEIPVTILPGKGETIHQLAARKAVKELEEGRGWLYHAKDAKDKGKLLKVKFEGRFSDMVEREAVRLGVTYQVGGKWCSFVAVDESKKGKKGEGDRPQAPPPAYSEAKEQEESSGDDMGFGLMDEVSYSAPPPAPAAPLPGGAGEFGLPPFTPSGGVEHETNKLTYPSTAFFSASSYSAGPPRPQLASFAAKRSRQSSSGFHSAASAPVMAEQAPQTYQATKSAKSSSLSLLGRAKGMFSSAPRGGFGSAPPADAMPCAAAAPPPPPKPMTLSSSPRLRDYSASSAPSRKEKSKKLGGIDYGLIERTERFLPARAHEVSDLEMELEGETPAELMDRSFDAEETLEAIVGLQTFEGSWVWSSKLLKVLGLNEATTGDKLAPFGAAFSTGTDLLATGLVLAYLEAKLGAKKDEWEMLADKARGWLEEQLKAKKAGVSVDEYVAKVKGGF